MLRFWRICFTHYELCLPNWTLAKGRLKQRYATGVNARINFLIKIDFVVREEAGGMRWGKKALGCIGERKRD